MPHFPSKEELMKMPIQLVRALDIKTQDEENLVQHVINVRIVSMPLERTLFRNDVPDIKTKEEEEKWQKIIDERTEALKPQPVNYQLDNTIEKKKEELKSLKDKIEEIKPSVTLEGTFTSVPVETTTATVTKTAEVIVVDALAVPKKFCDLCASKGVRHLKTCSKFIAYPKTNGTDTTKNSS